VGAVLHARGGVRFDSVFRLPKLLLDIAISHYGAGRESAFGLLRARGAPWGLGRRRPSRRDLED